MDVKKQMMIIFEWLDKMIAGKFAVMWHCYLLINV